MQIRSVVPEEAIILKKPQKTNKQKNKKQQNKTKQGRRALIELIFTLSFLAAKGKNYKKGKECWIWRNKEWFSVWQSAAVTWWQGGRDLLMYFLRFCFLILKMWTIRIWKDIERIQGDTACEGKL